MSNITIGESDTASTLTIGGTNTTTTTINSAPTGSLNIGTGTRTGAINIGTGAGSTGAINIGVKNDASTTGTPLTLNGYNIAIEPETTQVMNIATSQTTGTMNIGTGTRTGAINIGTGAGSTGTINIGVKNDASTTGTPLTLNGYNIAIEPETTQGMNIATSQTTGTMNIGTGTRTGAINIGTGAGSTGAINIGVKNDTSTTGTPLTLNGFNIAIEPETTQVMNIATSQTTGTMNIGTGTRTGAINIGTGAGSTGAINIGSATSATTIGGTLTSDTNVYYTSNTATSNTIEYLQGGISVVNMATAGTYAFGTLRLNKIVNMWISGTGIKTITLPTSPVIGQMIFIRSGASGGTLTLSAGTGSLLYPSNTNTSTGSIVLHLISASQWCYIAANRWMQMDTSVSPLVDTAAGTAALEIGSKVITGNILIGAALSAGDISIATGQTSGILNIGTGARLTSGSGGEINIGTGGNGATNLYIGHKGTITASTQAVKINTGTAVGSTGATTIGSSTSATTIGGSLAVAGVMSASGGSTLGGTTVTLSTQPTISYAVKAQSVTAVGFLGGRYEVAIALGTRTIITTQAAFCAMNALPAGLYHISPYVFIPPGVSTTVEIVLVTKTTAITEGATTGLVAPLNGSETYTFANATQSNSINSSWIYEVASPAVNIALGVKSGTNLTNTSAFVLKIVRIG